LASSYANAVDGIPIDIAGSGFNNYVVVSGRGITNGITMVNCDGCVVSNNTITGTTQNCIESYTSYNLIISDNALNMCGGGGNNAMLLSSNTNTIVKNNVINRTTILSQSTAIFENFKTIAVDIRAGSPIVQGAAGYYHPHWFTDKTITINGIDYTIKDVERDKIILTTNATTTLSGTTATLKFSNNTYLANFSADGVKLVTGGTSRIISNY
jgi:parallel beta-helix repeat protein